MKLLDSPQSHTKPTVTSTTTVFTTPAFAAKISTSAIATVVDNISRSNVTFGADVSTMTVADAGIAATKLTADQLTMTSNFSFGTTSSSNVSVVKNLTVKDSDAENSTELKSGVLVDGTFVTLPPAVIPGHVSDTSSAEENKTSSLTVTTAPVDSLVSDAENVKAVYESANVTGSKRTYENATAVDVSDSSVPDTRPSAAVNASVSFLDSETAAYEESSDYTVTASDAQSSVPVLLYGEV